MDNFWIWACSLKLQGISWRGIKFQIGVIEGGKTKQNKPKPNYVNMHIKLIVLSQGIQNLYFSIRPQNMALWPKIFFMQNFIIVVKLCVTGFIM